MSAFLRGIARWDGGRDRKGHRVFKALWKVTTTDPWDGPAIVMNCPGLPAIGSTWAVGNDLDLWAFCTPEISARQLGYDDEKQMQWTVEQTFTTIPTPRCQTASIENPLNEPMELGGSFVKYVKEATLDRNGKKIQSSSHERFRGAQVEFDDNRPTVTVGMNLASLPLTSMTDFMDKVNDRTLWGLEKRKVKLSGATWSRKLYGLCNYYYTVTYEFDINFKTFDRKVPDEGTKILAWSWTTTTPPIRIIAPWADPTNPDHYWPAKDFLDERLGTVPLKNGVPWDGTGDQPTVDVEYYEERNLLALGIPSSL